MSVTERVRLAKLALMAAEYLAQLGQAIEARRRELGLSRAEVATRIETWLVEHEKRQAGHHFDAQNVYRWERAKNAAGPDNLEALAAALKTTVAELARGIENGSSGMPADRDLRAQLDQIESEVRWLTDQVLDLIAALAAGEAPKEPDPASRPTAQASDASDSQRAA